MSKKLTLAESMRSAVQNTDLPPAPPPSEPPAASMPKAPTPTRTTTRAGKKKVTAPLAPEDHKRLKRLAIDQDATTESMLLEAINDLFAKYGLSGGGQGRGAS